MASLTCPQLDESADVVVVGGGITGCAIAYRLASEGFGAVVLDKRQLYTQASNSNAGNIHQQIIPGSVFEKNGWPWVETFAKTISYNVEAGQEWVNLGEQLDVDIDFKMVGGIVVAETAEDMAMLERKISLERRYGGTSEMVDAAQLRALAPYVSERCVGGSFCAEEGRANPHKAVAALARAARGKGAKFLSGVEVADVRDDVMGGQVVVTDSGAIRARHVVFACGAESDTLLKRIGYQLNNPRRAIQTMVTEAVSPFMHRLFYHARRRITMKQVANGNVIIGGGWPAQHGTQEDYTRTLSESISGAAAIAQDVVPRVGDLSLLRAWASVIAQPVDGLPVVGRVPGKENCWVVIPNNNGFTLAPVLSRMIVEMLQEKRSSSDPSLFDPARAAVAMT